MLWLQQRQRLEYDSRVWGRRSPLRTIQDAGGHGPPEDDPGCWGETVPPEDESTARSSREGRDGHTYEDTAETDQNSYHVP